MVVTHFATSNHGPTRTFSELTPKRINISLNYLGTVDGFKVKVCLKQYRSWIAKGSKLHNLEWKSGADGKFGSPDFTSTLSWRRPLPRSWKRSLLRLPHCPTAGRMDLGSVGNGEGRYAGRAVTWPRGWAGRPPTATSQPPGGGQRTSRQHGTADIHHALEDSATCNIAISDP